MNCSSTECCKSGIPHLDHYAVTCFYNADLNFVLLSKMFFYQSFDYITCMTIIIMMLGFSVLNHSELPMTAMWPFNSFSLITFNNYISMAVCTFSGVVFFRSILQGTNVVRVTLCLVSIK